MAVHLSLALLVGALLGACAPAGPTAAVGMVNATTIPVAVHVNGAWVGTFPAFSEAREIVIGGHGGPPWKVEFRGPDERVLADLDVTLQAGRGSGGGWSSTCGIFQAWWGPQPDNLPPLDPEVMRPAQPPCE